MNNKRIIHTMRWLPGLMLLAMLALLSACRDNLVPGQGMIYWEGDGRMVDIKMSIDAPEMAVRTRAVLPEERERQVEDLYVLMFKLDSDTDTNPKVVNGSDQRYFTRDKIGKANPEEIHSTAGVIELNNIPTGTYYIAAVANVKFGDIDTQKLKSDLDAVTDFNEFQAVTVRLQDKANLGRTYLCMSGYFMNDDLGSSDTHNNVHINPNVPHAGITPEKVIFNKSGQLDGYIHLRRLDSQIHFNIKQEIPGVEKFEVLSWKVVNIPSFASAIEEEHDLCVNPADFSEFGPNISGWTKSEGMNGYELDFYMLENRGVSKNPITEYGKRELENKTAEGLNNDRPSYVNAPANSAYLELEVKFQQQLPGSVEGTFLRDVTAKYIIHLGYCEALKAKGDVGEANKANDFNSRRNTKYTYNVIIRGAEEIVIEANSTDLDNELFNHGVEGTVIDVKGGQLIDLDAHYSVFNIILTRDELAHSHFVIESPNGYWSTVGKTYGEDGYPDPWTEDFQHIRLAYNDAATQQLRAGQNITKLVSYSKTYDHDCPEGTVISSIDEASHTLIPVHHEKKQIQDANHIYPLYDIYCLGNEYGSPYDAQNNPNGYTDDNKDEPLVFTVFVNEFYYYYPGGVIEKTEKYMDSGYVKEGTETTRDYTLWHKFADYTKGRSYMLLTDFRDSKDDESHHLMVKVHVHQRAIQTFYNEGLDQSVVGLEQINEHHFKNLSGYYWRENRNKNGNTDIWNDVGGWYRTNYWLGRNATFEGKKVNDWSSHVDQETIQGSNDGHSYPIFASKSVQTQFGANANFHYKQGFATDNHNYEIIDVAATRNRDLNRDGEITPDEVRWFAPSTYEYVAFAVGAGALQTPLFDKTQFDPAKSYWNANDNGHWSPNFKKVYYNGVFHYLGTDSWYMISEEGASIGQADYENSALNSITSNWATGLHTQYSGEVRCARYMGVPNGDNGYDGLVLPQPAEFNPANNVFTTTNFSSQLRRKPASGALPFHDNLNIGSNGFNSFSDYFQMASADAGQGVQIRRTADGLYPQENLAKMMNDNEFCRNYEDPEFGGRGTWRVPNQVEMALMVTYADDNEFHMPNTGGGTNASSYKFLSCTYWYRNQELVDMGSTAYEAPTKDINIGGVTKRQYTEILGARRDNEGRKTSLIGAGDLYENQHFTVRCVRDTDKDGNYAGNPEYGNPVNFQHLDMSSTYSGETVNYSVSASMDFSLVTSVSVTVDGNPANISWSGNVATAVVTGAEVTTSRVTAVWTINTTDGKVLTYRRPYNLPARYYVFANKRASATRYAYVNQNQASVLDGSNNPLGSNIEELGAEYKWKLVASTTDLTNVTDIQDNVVYYLYNAGYKSFLCAPSNYGQQANTLPISGTPARIKIKTVVDGGVTYRTMYLIDGNDSRRGWINFLGSGFGYWSNGGDQSSDDGNKWIFNGAMFPGEMPFYFIPGDLNTVYSTTDGTLANYSWKATFNSSYQVVSVRINGTTVPSPTVSGDIVSCAVSNDLIPENGQVTAEWTFRRGSDTVVKTHTYELPVKFYLITSILSSASWGYQYVYVDAEGKTRSNPLTTDMDKSRAPLMYRWVLSADTPSSTDNVLASEVVVDSNRWMYLFSQSAGAYIVKPSPYDNISAYLPTGTTPLRFCFDRTKNGGLEPYFKWDGCNTYGSCVNPSRAHDKYKFGLSPAGLDGAYWKFIPVYRDNAQVPLPPPVPIPVTALSLNQTSATLGLNETLTLTASASPVYASDNTVTWTSSAPGVASVSGGPATKAVSDPTTVVTARSAGTAIITATANDGSGVTARCTVTVKQPVTGIELNQTTAALAVNGTLTLSATVKPDNAYDKTVTWSSNNQSVATVNNGVVTAVGIGNATITATANDGSGVTATCTVTVSQPVTSIELNQTSLELEVGPAAVNTSATLSATVLPDTATDKSLIWESSNPDVVTVSAGPATKSVSGTTVTVTAVGVGEATITATANDGSGVKKTCTVTVKNAFVNVESITLPATASVGINRTITLTPTILPENATDKTVTWESSNTGIATVSNGVVTGKAQGTATITVRANDGSGRYATCTVTVSPVKVTSVSISSTSPKATAVLTATVSPNDATNKNVTWSWTGNTGYFTLTKNGNQATVRISKLSGSRQTVTITATAADGSGKKASYTVSNGM